MPPGPSAEPIICPGRYGTNHTERNIGFLELLGYRGYFAGGAGEGTGVNPQFVDFVAVPDFLRDGERRSQSEAIVAQGSARYSRQRDRFENYNLGHEGSTSPIIAMKWRNRISLSLPPKSRMLATMPRKKITTKS